MICYPVVCHGLSLLVASVLCYCRCLLLFAAIVCTCLVRNDDVGVCCLSVVVLCSCWLLVVVVC